MSKSHVNCEIRVPVNLAYRGTWSPPCSWQSQHKVLLMIIKAHKRIGVWTLLCSLQCKYQGLLRLLKKSVSPASTVAAFRQMF